MAGKAAFERNVDDAEICRRQHGLGALQAPRDDILFRRLSERIAERPEHPMFAEAGDGTKPIDCDVAVEIVGGIVFHPFAGHSSPGAETDPSGAVRRVRRVAVDVGRRKARDEIFGPVLPIIKVENEAHALQLANQTEYGLASAVFTRNAARGQRFAQGIRAGMTSINDQTVLTDIYGPFGGEKNSGLGHFNGEWIIEEFTRPHWITTQSEPRSYPF